MSKVCAKVLDSVPISGSIDEVWFDAVGQCTWVQVDTELEAWVGVFDQGVGRDDHAIVVANGRYLFMNAKVQVCCVELATRKLMHKSDCCWLQELMPVPDTGLVAACYSTSVYLFDCNRMRCQSDRIARDGIKFVDASSVSIKGRADHHNGWRYFTVDTLTGQTLSA
jgi:hypothetical protein